MRLSVVALLSSVAFAAPALAKDPTPDEIKGLYLTADWPVVTLKAGEEKTLSITIYNYGLPPQRLSVGMTGVPADWKPELQGGGNPVGAAFVDYDGRANLNLKLNVPADAKPGDYTATITATPDGGQAKTLPISIKLVEPVAAKLTATPKFPVLKGTPKSNFEFSIATKNESASDMTLNLRADMPKGFTATFKEGYNTQEITSLQLKANESKDISVNVKPSPNAAAGQTPIKVTIASDKATVTSDLTMEIAGQPTISITGEGERLSGDAEAGKEKSFPLIVRNNGTAPAVGLSMNSTPPSGWTVKFDPKDLPDIPVNGEQKVNALVTPTAKAIAGDYSISMRASGDAVSESAAYRVTVTTSTLWGVAGLGVIAVALLVLIGAVGRFGRR